ncbi:hypothetical protein [Streptomyces sp.]|uniref:hypothetical protein n=1 Tax=Streptomyces sp. TaxID=1931 RepID=UPI0034553ABB
MTQMISEPPEARWAQEMSGRRARLSASGSTRSGRQRMRVTHCAAPYTRGLTRPTTRSAPARRSAW